MNRKHSVSFLIGTYSQTGPYVPSANGEGIISCRLNLESGNIQRTGVCREAPNATYLDKSPDGRYIFSACDRFSQEGCVKAFTVDDRGILKLLSSRNAHGKSTCHISCDREGKMIFASSYMDGKLSAYTFDGEELSEAENIISYRGSGPNPQRQEQAHAHQATVSPDNRWLYVCDLGSDKIRFHRLEGLQGNAEEAGNVDTPAGYGPRHLAWNPRHSKAYVFCELNSHMLVYDWDEKTGLLTMISDIAALPPAFEGAPSGAAIRLHPTGRVLYVSDRGPDIIVVFIIDDHGMPQYESWFSVQGETPRDFAIDPSGCWLLSANQDTDAVVPFRLDPASGLPSGDMGPVFESGTPVSFLFL